MPAPAAIVPIVPVIQLKRILFATSLDDAEWGALNLVSALARRYHSTVFVAHICEARTYPMVSPEVVYVMENKHDRDVRRRMQALLRTFPLNSLPTRAIVRSGQTLEQLKTIVRQERIDLAVICTRGLAGVKHMVAGSVAEEAFRSLSCPVLTVGPHLLHRFASAEIKSILFPTDLSTESLAVLPYLASLAHEYKARITVLHVLPPETSYDPEAQGLTDRVRHALERALAPQISPECGTEVVIAYGHIAECILQQARIRGADLIGLGVRRGAGVSRRFERSLAYQVVANSKCPVLTCRF